MKTKIFIGCCVLLFPAFLFAQVIEHQKASNLPEGAIQFRKEEVIWKEAPSTLPAGSRVTVLEGNPKSEGMFTMRVELKPFAKINPHFHPREERVTIISGDVYLGFGEQMDTMANYTHFSKGSFYINPPKSIHYVFTQKKSAVLQITGMGPWELIYPGEKK